MIWPFFTSILKAFGAFGRPGMRRMEPVVTTTNPAPALRIRRSTGMRKPFGAPRRFASCVRESGVFAMQTGRRPKPHSSICFRSFFAFSERSNQSAP